MTSDKTTPDPQELEKLQRKGTKRRSAAHAFEINPFANEPPVTATDDNTVLDSYADENQRLSDRILASELVREKPAGVDPAFKWGLDYGKDLLKDINQLAHAAGTGALHRDVLQRAFREIKRLTAQPAVTDAVKMLLDTIDAKNARIAELEAALGKAVLSAPVTGRVGVIEECATAIRAYAKRLKLSNSDAYIRVIRRLKSPTAPDKETR